MVKKKPAEKTDATKPVPKVKIHYSKQHPQNKHAQRSKFKTLGFIEPQAQLAAANTSTLVQ